MKSSFPEKVSGTYPYLFLIFILVLLFSFAPVPGFKTASLATDFRWRKELALRFGTIRALAGDRIYQYVLVGKDGWLYYAGDQSIPDYQKTNPLTKKELVQLQEQLESLNTKLKSQGITLLVVIPPNKSTIYPQYMPDQIPVLGKQSALDRFTTYIKRNSDVPLLDLRPSLVRASQEQDVYYQTDSHWTPLGAYYGYVEIMDALSSRDPVFQPHSLSDFNLESAGKNTHDLARGMGRPDDKEEDWLLTPRFNVEVEQSVSQLPDGIHGIRTATNADQDLPSLLVFGDSFYNSLAPFIEPHFSRVKQIPYVSSEDVWSLSWIDTEKPDVVVIEIVERNLKDGLQSLLGD
jgi:hypothetical protein